MRKKLGECLIQAGVITDDELRRALGEHKSTGERLGAVLVRLGLANEEQVAKAIAFQLGFAFVDVADVRPDAAALALIPRDIAVERSCLPIACEHDTLTVAMSDPLLFGLVHDLERRTGRRITQVVGTRDAIRIAIDCSYSTAAETRTEAHASDTSKPDASSVTPPIPVLVDQIVKNALASHATDVHVEPTGQGVVIRHRLDGVLTAVQQLSAHLHEGLIARFKTIAGIDVTEKRLPQDGRLRVVGDDGAGVDFRVSTLRTVAGEKLVMRLLDQRKQAPVLDEIGLSESALATVRDLLRQPHGMILVAGPTGSGTTLTLTAALRAVPSDHTNIITIEDPVEYQIPGVNQTQISDAGGLTFAAALRSILNQDADVILLSHLRDVETATVAVHAAQTSQLILSTLRADAASSSVTQLADMGVERHAIASALLGVIAQRLVRRLCVNCRRRYTPPPETLRSLDISDDDATTTVFYQAVGCDQCNHTGYRGRVGVYEVMRVTDKVRRLISSNAPEHQLREAALAGGMISLGEDALAKVRSGVTTPDELLRVVSEVGETRALCAGCGAPVDADYLVCPHCGTRQGDGCPQCGRVLQPGWTFCPYCARGATEPRRIRGLKPRENERRRERPPGNVAEFKK
ncbi:MAG TPA: ATPase, T2SS/T4P/T4SS family [Vicinamibacterales bacterium]